MNDVVQNLTDAVQDFQRRTGEEALLVAVEDDGDLRGVYSVSYEPYWGLMVDGKQPSRLWYHQLQAFHLLQTAPSVLH